MAQGWAKSATAGKSQGPGKTLVLLCSHLKVSVKGLYQISYCSNSDLKMKHLTLSLKTLLFALSLAFWRV